MFNPFSLISDLNDACKAGQALENPESWSRRANLTGLFTVIVTFILTLLNTFAHIDLGLSADDIQKICAGFAIVGVSVANLLHTASNVKAGRNK
jgi:hypothetical protein